MAEPRPDSAPVCEYLNVHEDGVLGGGAIATLGLFHAF